MALLTVGMLALISNAYNDWYLAIAKVTTVNASNIIRSSADPISITSLTEAHLFGETSKNKSKASQPKPIEAPETRLRLKLRGVFAHSENDQSRALIAEQDKSAKYYRLGDNLPGGATLDAVASEYVTLNRNGVLETLSFNANKKKARTSPTMASHRNGSNSFAAQPNHEAKLVSQQNTESIKERLKRLREAREL